MNGQFITKPSEEMVEEVAKWFGFLNTDPMRFEADEIHHLLCGACNVLFVEGTGTGKGRMEQALEEVKSMAETAPRILTFRVQTGVSFSFALPNPCRC